ncbi:MAG: PAS domain-containing protein [Acidobacteriota bacterium]
MSQSESSSSSNHINEAVVQSLEDEIRTTREELQNTIEELETSNEELKASNEELKTFKEELQSLNEELTNMNTQLREKVEELEVANNDLDNLINSTSIATLFLDPELRLKRFTPATKKLLSLIPSDEGRPIGDLASKVSREGLEQDARKVLEGLQPVKREVQSEDNRWYIRQALPYRTKRNTAEGVVITFTDITEIRESNLQQERKAAELEAIMESVPAAVWIAHDAKCDRITGNRRSYEILRLQPGTNASKSGPKDEAPGNFTIMKDGKELAPEDMPIQRAAATGEPVMDFSESIVFDDGTSIDAFGNAVPIFDKNGNPRGAVAAFMDVSALKRTEAELIKLKNNLEKLVEERNRELARQTTRLQMLTLQLTNAEQRERRRLANILHDNLQQLLVAGKLQLGIAGDPSDRQDQASAIKKAEDLIDESLETTRQLAVELSPPVLYNSGLFAALKWLGERFEKQGGFQVEVTTEISDKRLEENCRILVFECVRELLLNAVKHSGTNKAAVKILADGDAGIRIVVQDRGVGFNVQSEEQGSSHFGLFHVRQRIESIGGCLDILSEPGKGTSVILICPVQPESSMQDRLDNRESGPAESHNRASSDDPVLQGLLVDDPRSVRAGLRGLIDQDPDFSVVGEAADGAEAIELTGRFMPDVILMDVNMPGMDGLEATRIISRKYPRISIVGLSVNDASEIAALMIEAGAVSCLNKHAAKDEVCNTLRKVSTRVKF